MEKITITQALNKTVVATKNYIDKTVTVVDTDLQQVIHDVYNYVDSTITLPDYPNKYDNPYKNKGSVVVKMQTHCHTTNSDGDGTIEQVINTYKNEGFNAICITEHDMVTETSA